MQSPTSWVGFPRSLALSSNFPHEECGSSCLWQELFGPSPREPQAVSQTLPVPAARDPSMQVLRAKPNLWAVTGEAESLGPAVTAMRTEVTLIGHTDLTALKFLFPDEV